MIRTLLHHRDNNITLEERIFRAIATVGVAAGSITCILVEFLHLHMPARVITAICVVWLALLYYVSSRWKRSQYICRVVLVCGLSFLFFPFGFFAGGGIDSSMTLLYLMGVFNIAALLRSPLRGILIAAQIIMGEVTIFLSLRFPELCTDLTPIQKCVISHLFLFISCTTLSLMVVLVLKAHEEERRRSQSLMEQLSSLSIHDPLTGLYNRRELFRRLEVLYQADAERSVRDMALRHEDFCIAMFDIDDFKQLNDTFGHQFGDKALSAVAHQFRRAMDTSHGELAARYGGEEFVCLFRADKLEKAFLRMDAVRGEIERLAFPEMGDRHITVSCGVVHCSKYDRPEPAIHDADALLYQAKHNGKNRVETERI